MEQASYLLARCCLPLAAFVSLPLAIHPSRARRPRGRAILSQPVDSRWDLHGVLAIPRRSSRRVSTPTFLSRRRPCLSDQPPPASLLRPAVCDPARLRALTRLLMARSRERARDAPVRRSAIAPRGSLSRGLALDSAPPILRPDPLSSSLYFCRSRLCSSCVHGATGRRDYRGGRRLRRCRRVLRGHRRLALAVGVSRSRSRRRWAQRLVPLVAEGRSSLCDCAVRRHWRVGRAKVRTHLRASRNARYVPAISVPRAIVVRRTVSAPAR